MGLLNFKKISLVYKTVALAAFVLLSLSFFLVLLFKSLNFLAAFSFIIFTLSCLFISLKLFFAKPLGEVIEVTEKISDGQFAKRVNIKREDEIGRLGLSINKLTDSLQSRIKEISLINKITQESTLSQNLSKVLNLILSSAIDALGVDSGSIMLLDRNQDLVIRAASDRSLIGRRIKFGQGIAGWVAKEKKPLILIDGIEDNRFSKKERVRDSVSVPILLGAKVVGVINLTETRRKRPFTSRDLDFLTTLANQAAGAVYNAQIFEELRNNYFSTIQALAEAIDAKDPYTHGHSARVAEYAIMVAKELGMSFEEMENLQAAAYLHDIGKIGIPEAILTKPGRLTNEEYQIIKTHPEIGARILAPVSFKGNVVPIVRHHHERLDGEGYPDRLKGKKIPFEARILAVADSFDAMTSLRAYRPPRDFASAQEELKRCAGEQFDKEVVEVFLKAVAPLHSEVH